MAYEGPFSKRQLDNLVQIVETELQFSSDTQTTDTTPIVLDATEQYSKSFTAKVTDNPVGDKSDRADNYRVYSPTLSFSGVISNDLMVSLFGLGGATGVYDWAFGEEDSSARCQQFVERLDKIFQDKRMVSIRMPDGLTTNNCMITDLNITRDRSQQNGFKIAIKAKQLDVRTTVILSSPQPTSKDIVEEPSDAGNKTGQQFDQYDGLIVGEQLNPGSSGSVLGE